MNVGLLRRIMRVWKNEPRRLDMEDFVQTGKPGPRCGTVGCIAGWVAILDKWKPGTSFEAAADAALDVENGVGRSTYGPSVSEQAREALRLDHYQIGRLFYLSGWPEDLGNAYVEAETASERVAVTIKRINLFIRTGGRR